MKKTKLFSRIFAAVLAVTVAATTLITNSGAGLLAFALGEGETEATNEGDEGDNTTTSDEKKYTVKIISPDVPADGKTYAYNFYQIIDGNVEDDGGVNVLGNAEWGAALGGKDFATRKYEGDNGCDITAEAALFLALSQRFYYNNSYVNYNDSQPGSLMYISIGEMFTNIYKTYGGSSTNPFKDKFVGSITGNNLKTRNATGLVEVLGKDTAVSKDGAALKAFAELLINDMKYNPGDNKTPKENYKKIKFITGEPQYTQMVEKGGTYTVTDYEKDDESGKDIEIGLKPGYYLVTCVDVEYEYEKEKNGSIKYDNDGKPVIAVDENGKPIILKTPLTNDGYETSMPIKPVSTMLILVGPANNGVAEIVGKNAYSVPTVTLEMYQNPVKLNMGVYSGDNDTDSKKGQSVEMKTENSNYNNNTRDGGGYDHKVEDIDTIIKENNWKTTGSFDYYAADDRQEAILYRIGITLPQNFDQYAESGYFLAVLSQLKHFDKDLNASDEIKRVTNIRPYIYKKSGSDYTFVGRYRGNDYDFQDVEDDPTVFKNVLNLSPSTSPLTFANYLTGNTNNTTYNQYAALGFKPNDLFSLGDLYTHETTNVTDESGKVTTKTTHTSEFKPGDTIYICYPAILAKKGSYLLNTHRACAIYTNNPYAEKFKFMDVSSERPYKCSHVVSGDVGITPIAEANVNTYGVTLKVTGEEVGGSKYKSGAKFALYRVVDTGKKDNEDNPITENEYAVFKNSTVSNPTPTYIKAWISETDLRKLKTEYSEKDSDTDKFKMSIEEIFLDNNTITNVNSNIYTYWTTDTTGFNVNGVRIDGLAKGTYYLKELTISSEGVVNSSSNPVNKNKPDHDNIKTFHYNLAEKPITFTIDDHYNENIVGYYGDAGNEKTIIDKLTVDFVQAEDDKKFIDTYVRKPEVIKTENREVTENEKTVIKKAVVYTTTDDGKENMALVDGNKVVSEIRTLYAKYLDEGGETQWKDTTFYATEDGQIEIEVKHLTYNLVWLPETGGIGTMIFYIVGGTIVLAATVLIVTRFRVKRERL